MADNHDDSVTANPGGNDDMSQTFVQFEVAIHALEQAGSQALAQKATPDIDSDENLELAKFYSAALIDAREAHRSLCDMEQGRKEKEGLKQGIERIEKMLADANGLLRSLNRRR